MPEKIGNFSMGVTGLEPTPLFPRDTAGSLAGDAESDAVSTDPVLQSAFDALTKLTTEQRMALMGMLGCENK